VVKRKPTLKYILSSPIDRTLFIVSVGFVLLSLILTIGR
jgi:hypothetical protein